MSKNIAAVVVANFILDHELFGFESLSDETTTKLINVYGYDFPTFVGKALRIYSKSC